MKVRLQVEIDTEAETVTVQQVKPAMLHPQTFPLAIWREIEDNVVAKIRTAQATEQHTVPETQEH